MEKIIGKGQKNNGKIGGGMEKGMEKDGENAGERDLGTF